MTVKLLMPYEGYPAGAQLSRDLVFETRMVQQGKASFDLTGSFKFPVARTDEILGPLESEASLLLAYPASTYVGFTALVGTAAPFAVYFSNGAEWLTKVGATFDSLAWGVKLIGKGVATMFSVSPSGDVLSMARNAFAGRTNAIQRAMGNTTAGVYTGTTTLAMRIEAEAPFSRVRFRLYSEAGAATNFKIAACATETAKLDTANNTSQPVVGGVAYPAVQASVGAPGWQIGSVGGVQNFDWPGAGAANAPKELVTDWFDICSVPRADGGTRPLIMLRVEHDASTNGNIGSGNISRWSAEASSQPWFRVLQAPNISGGGGVTDLTKTTTGDSTVTVWAAAEFQYNTPAQTVLGIGDSNIENAGTNALGLFGTWGFQGVMGASSPSSPMHWVNAGAAGAINATYAANGFTEIARLAPDVVVYAAGTSNDTPLSEAILQQWKTRLARTIYECKNVGARLICYGPLPGIAYNSASEVFRLAMRSHCLSLAQYGVIEYLDFETLLGTGASPNRIAAAMTSDGGTHVSNAAEVLMAKMLTDLLIAG